MKEKPRQSFEHYDRHYKSDYQADHMGPTEPADFGSGEGTLEVGDYCKAVRIRYVLGIQLMIQYQCEALVEKFKVTPLICGIAGSVWLRFIASTGVFDLKWGDDVLIDSEDQGKPKQKVDTPKYAKDEPRNAYNRRMLIVWFRYLRRKIPLDTSLAVSYLACHIAREPILPTDIQRWIMDGKLSYFSAFTKIEEALGRTARGCPLTASYMFRPSHPVPLQKLESIAGSIAECISLNLPPINFHAIASRYLRQQSLPVEKILPYAVCIFEWSMPPDLWLSTNEFRLPSRVCVMSIIIVAIRILYNINGLGKWESALFTSTSLSLEDQMERSSLKDQSNAEPDSHDSGDSDEKGGSTLSIHKFESEAVELLCNLEKRHGNITSKFDHAKDFPSYIHYCRDVVFSGLAAQDYTDEVIMHKLKRAVEGPDIDSNNKRSRLDRDSDDSDGKESSQFSNEKNIMRRPSDHEGFEGKMSTNSHTSLADEQELKVIAGAGSKDAAIRVLKGDMEETRFTYIPPRERVKRLEYLQYTRKKEDGSLSYVAHADYYILLRACAEAVEVDTRIMHCGVLGLERRLAWIEKRISQCL
ncbi:TATA box-binding protein-associated factor RNA polymerase I subunit B-like protein [Drosera capensis]